MFRKELKFNFKNFLIWTSIILGMLLVVYLIYPSIANSDNIQSMDEMVALFPEEVLKAMNMDIASMSTAFGWLKTEGFVMLLLIIGCFSGLLGSTILLKEENDKTAEYLNSLPIKRSSIVIKKFLVGIIYIVLMVLILGIFNYIGLALSGDFDKKQYILLSITPIFSSIVIYSFCIFISTFAHKTKKMFGLSLGIVFASYIFQALSEITDTVEFLKYVSAFTLADTRNVITEVSIRPLVVIISIALTLLFMVMTLIRYQRKD